MATDRKFASKASMFITQRLEETPEPEAQPMATDNTPPPGYRYQLVEKRSRRFQFMLAPSDFKAATAKAKRLKISLNEYFNRLVIADLQGESEHTQ